jgi:hypothetical protein
LPQPDEVYRRTHERRYELLLELVRGLTPARILVVGPSHESALLREVAPVDTVGWADDRFPRADGERHHEHDLNELGYSDLDAYDAVACGEVVVSRSRRRRRRPSGSTGPRRCSSSRAT